MQKKNTCELTRYEHEMIRAKAWQMCRTYGFAIHEQKDIEQELALELIRRLPKFDATKARRTTFASMIVRNRACNMARERRSEMRDPRLNGPSLNEMTHTREGEEVELIELVGQDEMDRMNGNHTRGPDEVVALRVDVEEVTARLPEPLRHVADLLSRMTIKEAADELRMPRSTFYQKFVAPLRAAFAHLAPYVCVSPTPFVTAG